MFSYTVTIGRNVGTEPMSDERWEEFQTSVTIDFNFVVNGFQAGAGQWEEHRGQGIWEGTPEDSFKVTVLLEEEIPKDRLDQLRRYLSENARLFDQDAIALTIGVSELC